MDREERRRHPDRAAWGAPRRALFQLGRSTRAVVYAIVGPLLTKHADGTITLSWTALFAGALLYAMMVGAMPAMGWPEVVVVVMTLYVKPFNDALNHYAQRNPEGLVNAAFGRLRDVVGSGAEVRTTVEQHINPPDSEPEPAKDGALG